MKNECLNVVSLEYISLPLCTQFTENIGEEWLDRQNVRFREQGALM